MSEPEPAPTERLDPRLRPLAAATLELLGELEPGDLLTGLTPERIGRVAGYSASSVRYRLAQAAGERNDDGDPRWSFDREQLLGAAFDLMLEHMVANSRASAARFAAAVAAVRAGEPIERLIAAAHSDLDTYSPGGSELDDAARSERAWLLAIALADQSAGARARLREFTELHEDAYREFWALALRVTGRVLREGFTISDLARQMSSLFEGFSNRRRFDPSLARDPSIGVAAASIFVGFTRPAEAPTPSPFDEILASLRRDGADGAR